MNNFVYKIVYSILSVLAFALMNILAFLHRSIFRFMIWMSKPIVNIPAPTKNTRIRQTDRNI